jgi:flagellar motility protein MotE (MotC chaperone)
MSEEMEYKTEFKITNDQQAEDYIEYVNEELTEIRAFKQRLSDKIQQLQMKLEKEEEKEERIIDNRNYYLQEYFNSVDDKLKHKTKTQEKYRLASGTIVKKYPKAKYKPSDKLTTWASENSPDYVETVKKLKWGDLKKQTELVGDKVIYKPTGEVLPLDVEYSDERFEFKEE